MKKLIVPVFVVIAAVAAVLVVHFVLQSSGRPAGATSRGTVETIAFHSKALQKTMQVDIYLPPGYSGSRTYPVLFFFHGKDSNAATPFTSLHMNTDADRLIASGQIQPLIIVSPEIDNSYGVNSATATSAANGYSYGKYYDYLQQELIPYIEFHYPVSSQRSKHYIGGFSMGGFVALNIALRNPSEFSKVGGHSAATWVNPNTVPALLMKQADSQLFQLAKTQDLSGMSFYFDCGTADVPYFIQGEKTLTQTLKARHIPVQLHSSPGQHDNAYWQSNASNYLLFYAGTHEHS